MGDNAAKRNSRAPGSFLICPIPQDLINHYSSTSSSPPNNLFGNLVTLCSHFYDNSSGLWCSCLFFWDIAPEHALGELSIRYLCDGLIAARPLEIVLVLLHNLRKLTTSVFEFNSTDTSINLVSGMKGSSSQWFLVADRQSLLLSGS